MSFVITRKYPEGETYLGISPYGGSSLFYVKLSSADPHLFPSEELAMRAVRMMNKLEAITRVVTLDEFIIMQAMST